jgi:hypothetical protein
MQFLNAGFLLREDIIKVQHNTASDRGKWQHSDPRFYKIAHEHLFVLRKPEDETDLENLRESSIKLLNFESPGSDDSASSAEALSRAGVESTTQVVFSNRAHITRLTGGIAQC